jgi:hypothetical protein
MILDHLKTLVYSSKSLDFAKHCVLSTNVKRIIILKSDDKVKSKEKLPPLLKVKYPYVSPHNHRLKCNFKPIQHVPISESES